VGRPALLVAALTVSIMLIAVACGGGSDDDSPDGQNRDNVSGVVMSTFTPTVVGATPEANVTQEARQTAAAQEATRRAENPPPPTATRDPNAEPEEEGLRPPYTWLSDGEDQIEGVFGAYGWFDDDMETYAGVAAPFYDVGDSGLTVAPGAELEFILQEDVDDPTMMTVSIYTWADNSAIPTGTDGSVGAYPWFVPAVAPVNSVPLEPGDTTFAMPNTPDRYVVQVQLQWPRNELLPNDPQFQIFAIYAFTVYVS
jgi:hypothetical protein